MKTHSLNNCSNKSGFFKKLFVVSALILFHCQLIHAQLKLVPITEIGIEDTGNSRSAERTEASINLPFFDDFSTTVTTHPNTKYWMPGSGVYINNTLTVNHPSVNVATFDGVNSIGTPYNFVNPLFQNFTDTLTSQPINLEGKAAKDSIYLSFYWEGKGLGEKPDSSDYLSLEFLNKNLEWSIVWTRNGYNIDTLFHQQLIAIKESGFLHNAFQFRFRGYGRNSGPYDTWHLDYVYLNEKRNASDKFIRDITVRKPLTPLFKNYTSMPLRQYKIDPKSATAVSVSSDIVNLNNRENINSFTFTVQDKISGKKYFTSNDNSVYIGPYTGVGPFRNQERIMKLDPITVDPAVKSVSLQYKMEVLTTDDQNPIVSIDLKRNDTISAYADLSDYYAFDDGSAEYGVQVNQKLGRAAVRYILAKPDTIGGVRLALVPYDKDISGQSFTVQLYSNKAGKPDQLLTQRSVSARYADNRNGFLEYAFSNAVAVTDTFYVGWLQINDEPITFGFDRNSILGKNNIFYNLGSSWAKETSLNGSIMLRPYLSASGREVVAGTEPVLNSRNYFFPNPGKGIINWKNALIKRIDVYSAQGSLVQTIIPEKNNQSATLNVHADGIYIIKGSDGKQSFVQKLLIVK